MLQFLDTFQLSLSLKQVFQSVQFYIMHMKKTETFTKTEGRKQVKNLMFSWEGKKKRDKITQLKRRKLQDFTL